MASVFDHPPGPHRRRHGPVYDTYPSYRDWLRDEFDYRCVYCLHREGFFARSLSEFHIDHVEPRAIAPHRISEYDNLAYSCAHCNKQKGAQRLPAPETVAYGEVLRLRDDATYEARTPEGNDLIRGLNLNSDENTEYRRRWLRILKLAEQNSPDLYAEWLAYPQDLPDLGALNPKSNSRPDGVRDSAFAKRARGALPSTY